MKNTMTVDTMTVETKTIPGCSNFTMAKNGTVYRKDTGKVVPTHDGTKYEVFGLAVTLRGDDGSIHVASIAGLWDELWRVA